MKLYPRVRMYQRKRASTTVSSITVSGRFNTARARSALYRLNQYFATNAWKQRVRIFSDRLGLRGKVKNKETNDAS